MKLKELKFTDFQKGKKYDFLFPIGSTEQHGPFIPLGTDTYITNYLVEQLSEKFPKMIILPTLEYSRSQEHRGFYGTLWLTEETLERIMFDICNSLKNKARNIFIISFHANDNIINRFIKRNSFQNIKIINLQITHEADDNYIEKNILHGHLDAHAGNSEISNMLIINKKLVKLPPKDFLKKEIKSPWETDNLIEKSSNGIVDNNPKWIVNSKVGKRILDIYTKRVIENLKNHLKK